MEEADSMARAIAAAVGSRSHKDTAGVAVIAVGDLLAMIAQLCDVPEHELLDYAGDGGALMTSEPGYSMKVTL